MKRTSMKYRVAMGVGTISAIAFIFISVPQSTHAQSAGAGCAGLLAARLAGTASGAPAGAAASAASIASGLPVHDLAAIATQLAVSQGQVTQDVTKCTLDSLQWTVTKMAIQSITRSTVNWINSGFNGSPAFITDLNQNLSVLNDTVAKNFFQQLNQTAINTTGFNLTSPFQDQITQQLRANYYKTTGSLLGGNQYDLSNYSSNPQAFLNGDFNQGGFNAFFAVISNPANNPFGAYKLASNALSERLDAATQQRKLEYVAGKGFGSWRGNCPTLSADPIADSISVGTGLPSANSNVLSGNPIADSITVDTGQTEPCYGSPIRTPGSVIESQLENQLGSGVRQLELSNSIDQIVGALFGQLVNQVLGGSGLSGISQPSSGGGSSYLTQATNPTQYSSTLSNGVTQVIANDLSTLTAYRNNWQKILDAATAAQQTCGTRSAISAVITQATAGVAKASTAIQQETSVSQSMEKALNSNTVNSSTQITTGFAQYQSYLGAATTPSSSDEAYAAAQSADTSGTLYSQMVAAKTSCPVQT